MYHDCERPRPFCFCAIIFQVLNLVMLQRSLGKTFATGASVVVGPTEKEQIDVQGDISYDIVEFITEAWPDVLETAIFFIEDGMGFEHMGSPVPLV
ncbi:hypothetical protein F0562_009676 [Nyssa sinensis]|uniref:SUI1 domain-containing protein n=1 Tax=Nyssa sinensis TaxID=561372 RepID=A0A5J4ZWN6_9ASTE|nr:hypothetical protein F0562_009676 [Nyssa sinensis]